MGAGSRAAGPRAAWGRAGTAVRRARRRRATCSRARRARAAGLAPGAWRARPRGGRGCRVTSQSRGLRLPAREAGAGRDALPAPGRVWAGGPRRSACAAPPGPTFPSVFSTPGDAGRIVCGAAAGSPGPCGCAGPRPAVSGASGGARGTGPRGGGHRPGFPPGAPWGRAPRSSDPGSPGAGRRPPLIRGPLGPVMGPPQSQGLGEPGSALRALLMENQADCQ